MNSVKIHCFWCDAVIAIKPCPAYMSELRGSYQNYEPCPACLKTWGPDGVLVFIGGATPAGKSEGASHQFCGSYPTGTYFVAPLEDFLTALHDSGLYTPQEYIPIEAAIRRTHRVLVDEPTYKIMTKW